MTAYKLRQAIYGGSDVVRAMPKKKRRSASVPTDRTLQKLWRLVVLAEWQGKCALFNAGTSSNCSGIIECHHIKKRRIPHLRHCPTNGVPLCKRHHELAAYRAWQRDIDRAVGEEKMEWLDAQEQILFPAYLLSVGMTRNEFLKAQKKYLQSLLEGRDGINT